MKPRGCFMCFGSDGLKLVEEVGRRAYEGYKNR